MFTPSPSVERDRNLALDHLNRGLMGMASEVGERLIDEHPRRFDGHYILARVAKETSDFGMGLKHAQTAMELSPSDEAELYRLTVLHATMSGNNPVAEDVLERLDKRACKMDDAGPETRHPAGTSRTVLRAKFPLRRSHRHYWQRTSKRYQPRRRRYGRGPLPVRTQEIWRGH